MIKRRDKELQKCKLNIWYWYAFSLKKYFANFNAFALTHFIFYFFLPSSKWIRIYVFLLLWYVFTKIWRNFETVTFKKEYRLITLLALFQQSKWAIWFGLAPKSKSLLVSNLWENVVQIFCENFSSFQKYISILYYCAVLYSN